MASTRKCLCCQRTYEYCPSCGNSNQPWKFNFDTEDCKEIFNVVSGYNMGIMGLDKIEEVIKKYNITDFSKYKEDVRNLLNSKIGKAGKTIRAKEVIDEVVETPEVPEVSEVVENVTEEVKEEIIEEPKEEIIEEEKPKYVSNAKRRRSRFFEQ